LDDQYYDSESDLTGLLDDNYADIQWDYNQTTPAETYADTEDAKQDECSEITGCVENAVSSADLNATYIVDADLDTLSELNTQITDATFYDVCSANNARVGTGCSDVLTETELDSISELNTQITDATILVSGGTLTNTNLCVADGTGGAIDCNIAQTTYLTELKDDTSPQLGGYLDTNGQNIGSTTDEIENIYQATNQKLYQGDGQEGSYYYNGSCILIGISGGSTLEIC